MNTHLSWREWERTYKDKNVNSCYLNNNTTNTDKQHSANSHKDKTSLKHCVLVFGNLLKAVKLTSITSNCSTNPYWKLSDNHIVRKFRHWPTKLQHYQKSTKNTFSKHQNTYIMKMNCHAWDKSWDDRFTCHKVSITCGELRKLNTRTLVKY